MIAHILNYAIGVIQMSLIAVFGSALFPKRFQNLIIRVVIILAAPAPIFIANLMKIDWLNFLVSIMVGLLLVFLLYKSRWYWLTLVGAASILALGFCEGATAFLATMILRDNIEQVVANPITSVVIVLISTLLFAILVWTVRLVVIRITRGRNAVYLSSNIGVIALLMVSVVVASYTVYVDSFTDFDFRLSMLGVTILFALILVDAYFIFGNEHDRKHYRMQNEILTMKYREEQLTALISQQDGYLDKLKAVTHDFKKHLHAIMALAERDSSKGFEPATQQYIDEMLQTIDSEAHYSDANNRVLEVILSTTEDKCEAEGIEYTSIIQHHDFSFMSFKDTCTLFSNAIDNALDSCLEMGNRRQKRFIELNILRQNEVIMVEIVNSKSHEVKTMGQQILTTKLAESEHGYGMKNMREIAHSYEGDIFYKYSDDSFTLTITLAYPLAEI